MSDPDWRELLRGAASESLDRTGRGLLLSQVPAVFKRAGLDPVAIIGRRKLLEFLQEASDGAYQLVQDDLNKSLWAILPPNLEVQQPVSQYFPSAERPKPSDDIPRFFPTFWQAFQRPLDEGRRRWLRVGASVSFDDRSEEEAVGGAIEIEREFIRDESSLFTTNEVVYTNIQLWAAKHDANLRQFLYVERSAAPPAIGSVKNPLEIFLSELRPTERTRISLPADVVARFLGIQ